MFNFFKTKHAKAVNSENCCDSRNNFEEITEPETMIIQNPKENPTSLWSLLRESGITEEQLAKAYDKRKKNQDKLFGMILVEDGIISGDYLEFMLEKQKVLITDSKESFAKVIKMVTEKNSEAINVQKDIQACAYQLTDALKAKG